MATPRPPGPADRGRRGDYHLLFIAQQQVEQLQLFSARLQQQIRNLQAQLQDADDKVSESDRGVAERIKLAEAIRRMLPKLRERLEGLKPSEGAKADLARERKLAKALQKLAARIEELELAHDNQLKEALRPKPKPNDAPPAQDDGELRVGEGGDLALAEDKGPEANPELLAADDVFGDVNFDDDDDEGLGDELLGADGSMGLDLGDPDPGLGGLDPGLGGVEGSVAPAAAPSPLPATVPAPQHDSDREETRREFDRLRKQSRLALGATAAAIVLAIGLNLRGRPAPSRPAAPAAAAQASAPDVGVPLHPPTLAEKALKLVQGQPVGRDQTMRSRLALMTPPGAPLPEDARWRVGLCEARGCDVSYSAGLVDPATGAELLYLFHADTARREVRGLNEPARVILKKR